MPRFLSDEWLAELSAAAPTVRVTGEEPAPDLVVEQVVERRDGGEVRWHVRSADGAVTVVPGPAAAAGATLLQDEATALAIATGRLNAQQAFISGRLRVQGDVEVLLRATPLFAALEAAFAGVRERTTYLDAPDAPDAPEG